MNYLSVVVALIFLSLSNVVKADTNITFVDMDKIISTSKPGLFFLNQLKELNDKNIEKFTKSEKILKAREKKIIAQKNIISEEIFRKEIEILKLDIKKYNNNRNKAIADFNEIKVNNTNRLLQLINPVLANYSDENSISLILQKKNLIIGKTELDITDQIILTVNKNIKDFKIK
mgnify:CR=1 FL=1|jgi:outer membrane protein